MANTKSKRRQRGSIRPNGAGFQVRVYAGRDPLTKKDIYLYAQAVTEVEAEKARTSSSTRSTRTATPRRR